MKQLIKILFFLVLLIFIVHMNADDDIQKSPLLMPDVQPKVKETYLCTAFKMPRNASQYIVEFEPNASMHTAHHMMIFGCDLPGQIQADNSRLVWDCGQMGGQRSGYLRGPACSSGFQVIYAWAKDAPPLELPNEVGFKVGNSSGINYLVLQVHYADVDKFLNGGTDNSGIIISLLPGTTNKVTKPAGVYVLSTYGRIRAGEEGKVVSGYKIDKSGNWTLIGKRNPQDPQMFYPVEDKNLTIGYGDIMATRCTMYNFRDTDTYIGYSSDDEMCTYYIMYYINADRTLSKNICFTSGPPDYYWSTDSNINYVPWSIDISASSLED
ncbi:peptidylglycine alpha-hydroxylating monooxygenase-like isoform X2 [Stegodyphus dumicola]|uniref:peptidylglycine alpha-hydroxylating monooxygenase-like isoform X2 n=1 Tax=Stegodyphus dumicola TaxID=202533 RepID=UPI0015B26B15|nr:peptidylglycine alpha-hydroxylating monooxygenase-like isoform X2 [Stegodyphus dumicola]